MLQIVGFPRSGSSLLGYLLTAHPNMIVADEALHLKPNVQMYSNLDKIFNQILRHDYDIQLRARVWSKLKKIFHDAISTKHREGNYILIHNQYQGRFKQLKVIGNKDYHLNVPILLSNDTLKLLKKSTKENNIAWKWIFPVRNPYDMYSTMLRYFHPRNQLIEICLKNKEFLQDLIEILVHN